MAWRAPNAWLVAAFAALAGGGIGASAAALQAALRPWQVGGFRPGTTVATAVPRAEVAATAHAFGSMPAGGSGSHVFEIRNAGSAPLTLTRGASSCSCTIGGFAAADGTGGADSAVVPPGASTPVTVRWKGKGNGPFRQQVTILTDDPRRPEIPLVVEGTILPSWKPVPPTIVLPRVSMTTGAAGGATVFTYGDRSPVVKSLTIDHPEAAQFALSSSPLAAADLAAERGATGGFRIEVEAKAGLPPGRLRQTVTAVFDIGEEVTAELPLEGSVASDILITGPGWDSGRQTLVLGTVSAATGLKTRLFLTAKGEHRDAVRPEVREVVPASLVVSVGPPAPVGTAGSLRIPLEITVPPGSRPANHLCSQSGPPGRIVLATGHPEAPTLTIPVCIAIGP